jgi:hypothetical protein
LPDSIAGRLVDPDDVDDRRRVRTGEPGRVRPTRHTGRERVREHFISRLLLDDCPLRELTSEPAPPRAGPQPPRPGFPFVRHPGTDLGQYAHER